MAEPNPLEDQSTAKGYQMDQTGDELMATLAKAESSVQPEDLAPVDIMTALAFGAR